MTSPIIFQQKCISSMFWDSLVFLFFPFKICQVLKKITSEALFLFKNRSLPQLISFFLSYLFYSYVISNATEAHKLMCYYSFRHWIFLASEFSASSVHKSLSSCTYSLYKNGAQCIFSKITSLFYLVYRDEQVLMTVFNIFAQQFLR